MLLSGFVLIITVGGQIIVTTLYRKFVVYHYTVRVGNGDVSNIYIYFTQVLLHYFSMTLSDDCSLSLHKIF